MTSTILNVTVESTSLVLPPSGAKQGVCRLPDVKDCTWEKACAQGAARACLDCFVLLLDTVLDPIVHSSKDLTETFQDLLSAEHRARFRPVPPHVAGAWSLAGHTSRPAFSLHNSPN